MMMAMLWQAGKFRQLVGWEMMVLVMAEIGTSDLYHSSFVKTLNIVY